MRSYFSLCYEFSYGYILAKKIEQKNVKYKKTGSVSTCKHNTGARSPSHFCHRKAKVITYYDFVFVALVIQHAKRLRPWLLRLYNIFPRYLINDTIFGGGEKNVIGLKCVF